MCMTVSDVVMCVGSDSTFVNFPTHPRQGKSEESSDRVFVSSGPGCRCVECGEREGEWWGRPPPFLHADSELAGVSPAVSAQS